MDRQPSTGIVFGVEPLTSKLYKINTSTGATTLVGNIGVNTIITLAFDPTTGVLYAYSQAPLYELYTIDPNTAQATLVGPTGQARRGLVCSSTGQLYIFGFNGRLFSVDKFTGASTTVGAGPTSITLLSDATFTPDGKLYASDFDGSLHEIDTFSGVETLVGNTGLGNGLLGLVDADGCPATSTYCTAKINALGCSPTMSSTGTASATSGSGFVVKCTQVRNQKSGLLFYGVNGQSANPFQGGTLCVKSPIKRTAGQSSGGTPAPNNDCTGVWSIDMNAFALSGGPPIPLAALQVSGTTVDCQWWGRDPGYPAPNNTQLSNGLHYTICN
jgi:hypothetical protein